MFADGVQRGPKEIGVADARNFDRILKREEQPFASGFFRLHGQQILAVEGDFAAGDVVGFATGKYLRKGAFPGAVRAHDRVDFTGIQLKVDAAKDLAVFNPDLQVLYVQKTHSICPFSCRRSPPTLGRLEVARAESRQESVPDAACWAAAAADI